MRIREWEKENKKKWEWNGNEGLYPYVAKGLYFDIFVGHNYHGHYDSEINKE